MAEPEAKPDSHATPGRGSSFILEVEGTMHGTAAISLKTALEEAVREAGAGSLLIVDLTKVDGLDSEAIGYLVTARNALRLQEARLAVAGLQPDIREVFVVTKLDALFPIFDSCRVAMRELGQAPAGDGTDSRRWRVSPRAVSRER